MIIINQISKNNCPPCRVLKSKFYELVDKVNYSYIEIDRQMDIEDSELVNNILKNTNLRSLPIIVITNDDEVLYAESITDIDKILEIYNKLVAEDTLNEQL